MYYSLKLSKLQELKPMLQTLEAQLSQLCIWVPVGQSQSKKLLMVSGGSGAQERQAHWQKGGKDSLTQFLWTTAPQDPESNLAGYTHAPLLIWGLKITIIKWEVNHKTTSYLLW